MTYNPILLYLTSVIGSFLEVIQLIAVVSFVFGRILQKMNKW